MSSTNDGQERVTLELLIEAVDFDWETVINNWLSQSSVEASEGPDSLTEDNLDKSSITVRLKFYTRPDGEKFLEHVNKEQKPWIKINLQNSSVVFDKPINCKELSDCISSIRKENKESKSKQKDKCSLLEELYRQEQARGGPNDENLSGRLKEAEAQLLVFQEMTEKIEARCDELLKRLKSSAQSDSSSVNQGRVTITKRDLLELNSHAQHERHMLETALPIYTSRKTLVDAVKENQVTVVVGATGCGKSTQLVQYLLRDIEVAAAPEVSKRSKQTSHSNRGKQRRLFVCSEPRKVVACSLQRHVQSEVGESSIVAYNAGNINSRKFDSSATRITFMTHHSLLSRLVGDLANANEKSADSFLDECAALIIDEAHERTIYSDMLIGLLRRALSRNRDLKLVIMSATLQVDEFKTYFDQSVKVIEVPGRTYPIEINYASSEISAIASVKASPYTASDDEDEDYVLQTVLLAKQMHEKRLKSYDQDRQVNNSPAGILVFLTSPEECEEALSLLVSVLSEKGCKHGEVSNNQQRFEGPNFVGYCLHGELSPEEQQRLFEKVQSGKRKIVFATNVAETSVTIPEIGCVIDCGLSKQKRYDTQRRVHVLEKQPIARSAAEQRKGRAGRTRPGLCFRLYTKEEFDQLPECELPEILRIHLGIPLLLLLRLNMKIEDIKSNKNNDTFRFVKQPNESSIDSALKDLVRLRAYDETSKCLTEHGEKMVHLVSQIELELANLVLLALDESVAPEGVLLAAMLSVQPNKLFILRSMAGSTSSNDVQSIARSRAQSRNTGLSLRERVASVKRDFVDPRSDMLTLINIFQKWISVDNEKRDQWCRKRRISVKLMRLANEIYTRLVDVVYRKFGQSLSIPDELTVTNGCKLRHVIFKTYAPHIAKLQRQPPSTSPHATADYLRCDTKNLTSAHYSSLVGDNGAQRTSWPNWIVFEHVLEIPGRNARNFMVNCTEIDPEWLLEPSMREVLTCVQPYLGAAGSVDSDIPVTDYMLLARFVGRDSKKLRELNEQLNRQYPNSPVEVKVPKEISSRIQIIAPDNLRSDVKKKVIEVLKQLNPEWTEPVS